MLNNNIDIASFKRAQNQMVQKNSNSWGSRNGHHSRTKDSDLEEIQKIVNSSSLQSVRTLSRDTFNKGGLYTNLILYYATLLRYAGLLIPNPGFGKKLSTPHIKKRYFSAMRYVDGLNLPEIATRIATTILVDGAYYGAFTSLDKESFAVIDLPTDFCRSRVRDLYGNDIVDFDVSYFDTIFDSTEKQGTLKSYPSIISTHYKKYNAGKITDKWVRLPASVGFCFSIIENEVPYFLSTIPATVRYDEAVDTERERELEEIRKIIVQKIPHLNDGQLLFEPPEAVEIHAGAVGMMKGNKNISVLTTYADVDSIVSKTSSENISNSLEKMLQNVYAKAGVSGEIFAPTGSQALSTSITNDIGLMMVFGNKFARFLSYVITNIFGNANITFKYLIFPISYFNESDFITDSLKLAQSGYSFLVPSLAIGLNQSDLISIKELENDVLNMKNILIPLSTSYTESSDSGAPSKKIEKKAEQTIKNEQALD